MWFIEQKTVVGLISCAILASAIEAIILGAPGDGYDRLDIIPSGVDLEYYVRPSAAVIDDSLRKTKVEDLSVEASAFYQPLNLDYMYGPSFGPQDRIYYDFWANVASKK